MSYGEEMDEAVMCMNRLAAVFRGPPEGDCGLHLEMKNIARLIEKEGLPLPGLKLDDFSKNYPFLHISPNWAGYFLVVVSFKIIESLVSGDLDFLEDTIMRDYLAFFEKKERR